MDTFWDLLDPIIRMDRLKGDPEVVQKWVQKGVKKGLKRGISGPHLL